MTMRVPAEVSSTKHDCPSQVSLPIDAPAACAGRAGATGVTPGRTRASAARASAETKSRLGGGGRLGMRAHHSTAGAGFHETARGRGASLCPMRAILLAVLVVVGCLAGCGVGPLDISNAPLSGFVGGTA